MSLWAVGRAPWRECAGLAAAFRDDQARRQTEIERQKEDTAVKKIALTYDDGPDPVYTEGTSGSAGGGKCPGYLFLLGQEIAGQEETVKKMYAAGPYPGKSTPIPMWICWGCRRGGAGAAERKTNEVIAACTGEYPQYFRPPLRTVQRIDQQTDFHADDQWTLDTSGLGMSGYRGNCGKYSAKCEGK